MKIAIMQPYFFPYIGYFQLIHAVDRFILYEHVNYIGKQWMNRNRLMLKGAQPVYFTMPVQAASCHKMVSEIIIDSPGDWKRKFFLFLYYNYGSSPFFKEINDLLLELLASEATSLHQFNFEVVAGICRFLDIQTEIVSNNGRYLELEADLAAKYDHGSRCNCTTDERFGDKKSERVIKICQREQMRTYINPIGGTELYDKALFQQHGIKLHFLKTRDISYSQFSRDFVPNLSIIDVLMCNGKATTRSLLNEYDLV